MRHRLVGTELELPSHHGNHVGCDPGMKADPALGGLTHVGLEELVDRLEQLGSGRDIVGRPGVSRFA